LTIRYGAGMLAGVLIGAAIWAGLVAMQVGVPTASSRWQSKILEKKEAIGRRCAGPRVMLLAGSNVHFGLRPQDLSRFAGACCVNYGSHAGLGRRYLLARFRGVLHTGDVAMLCPEYEFYEANDLKDTAIDYILARDPTYLRQLGVEQLRIFYGVTPQ